MRWAIVGTGWMSSGIARALERIPDARLVGVAGRDLERATTFAHGFGCEGAYPSLGDCLAAVRPDIVYVGSPNAAHADHVAEAIAAGAHVLADKPLALSAARAVRLRDQARRQGVGLGINLQVRKHPALAYVRRSVDAGRIGTVVRATAHLSMGVDPLVGWRADPEQAGAGSIHNLGAHALDTLMAAVGAVPARVSAVQRPAGAVLDLTTSVLLDFDDGPIGAAMVSQATLGDDVVLELAGTRGRLRWTGFLAPYRSGAVVIETDAGRQVRRAVAPDAYVRLVRDFQAAVRRGRDPEPGADAAVTLASVTDAIIAAALSGTTVAVVDA
jgi:predicted dehydrogenase